MPTISRFVTATTPRLTDHPAVASATRAIARGLSGLTAAQVFHVAALVETLQYGEDRGAWRLSARHAADHPSEFVTRQASVLR